MGGELTCEGRRSKGFYVFAEVQHVRNLHYNKVHMLVLHQFRGRNREEELGLAQVAWSRKVMRKICHQVKSQFNEPN